jgi:hypothetical protein
MTTISSPAITIDHEAATAWLVDTPGMSVGWELRNRPCDTCLGTGFMTLGLSRDTGRPCHCIDGRHTFTLDVAAPFIPYCDVYIEPTTITVHVVAVLPIQNIDSNNIDTIWDREDGTHWWVVATPPHHNEPPEGLPVTLPDSAAPGMWAVQMEVRS